MESDGVVMSIASSGSVVSVHPGSIEFPFVSGAFTTTSNDQTYVTGSAMDIRLFVDVFYKLTVSTNTLTVKVFVANKPDFTDETEYHSANITAGSTVYCGGFSYGFPSSAVPVIPGLYIRLKAAPASAGQHGTLTFTGSAK